MHEETTPPAPVLRRALAAASAAHPELLAEITERSPQEPYRTYLLYVAQRLAATRGPARRPGLPGPAAYLADLRVVQDSLAEAGAAKQAFGELQHLIWSGRDLRLPPGRAGGTPAQRGARPGAGRAAGRRAARRRGRLRGRPSPVPTAARGRRQVDPPWSARPRRCWPRSARWPGSRTGSATDACRRYVVSFTRSADDIAAVYELARYAMADGRVPELDVVPLFESAAT